MAKINLDKYYTPSDLAEYCVKKTKEVIGVENITEWLEPSAGAGVFLPYLDGNYLAFDIEPEAENIEQKKTNELLFETLKMKQFYVDEYHKPDVILDSSLVELITKNIKLMSDFVKFLHNALI